MVAAKSATFALLKALTSRWSRVALSLASGAGTPPVSGDTAPPGTWRLSATWMARANRPVAAATRVKTSFVEISPWARLLASLPADPTLGLARRGI